MAAAVVLAGLTTSPAAAQTTICSGVSVRDVAKCDPGWAANMHFMHWRMYSGHNCTNYVAYRLKRDGVPMPTYRLGNADTWAPNAKRNGVRVDSTPAVGAVGAWPGRRHVVYVEEVGPNYLITSEDNWPGYYPKGMYRKIKVFKGERAYPTQFIHFKGKNTINGPLPSVTGTPTVGSTLTAKAGTWSPSDVTLKYQWLRDGVIITGATKTSYTLTTADVGHTITIAVTGSKSGFASRTASSAPIGPVKAGKPTPTPTPEPTNTPGAVQSSTPTVSGEAKRGRILTGDPGTLGSDRCRADLRVVAGRGRRRQRHHELQGPQHRSRPPADLQGHRSEEVAHDGVQDLCAHRDGASDLHPRAGDGDSTRQGRHRCHRLGVQRSDADRVSPPFTRARRG